MKGIVLIAVGEENYIYWAYNQAMSIKFYSDVKIQLITEKRLYGKLDKLQRSQFDHITYLEEEEVYDIKEVRYKTIKKLNPGRVKIEMYDKLIFDETIYLDVDGITIKDIKPLFDLCDKDYHAQYQGKGGYQDKPWGDMIWAKPDIVFDHFQLPKDTIIPFINSSFQYIKKGKLCDKLYERARFNLENCIPIKDLYYQWGGVIPDELVMNVTFAQLGIDPTLKAKPKPLYFSKFSSPPMANSKVQESFFGLGYWGDRKLNHYTFRRWYNEEISMISKTHGRNIEFKIDRLFQTKFVLSK